MKLSISRIVKAVRLGESGSSILEDLPPPRMEERRLVNFLRDKSPHFFVDIATSVPQYLVCKHATVPFVGLHK
jgi:hypothetical protein